MDVTSYLDVISLIERLHREFLELVKLELESLRIRDINNVQALLLFNVGDAEMTVGELTSRGCYLGSNVSYNVKKMVESGYLRAERSAHDLRSTYVKLTNKAVHLCDQLRKMHIRHADLLSTNRMTESDLQNIKATLHQLERFWMEAGNPLERRVQNIQIA